jgi:hypothetical protein
MDQNQPDEPVCTHDDNCLVAGHPGGLHGDLADMQWGPGMLITQPCPASIWLLGAGAQCSLPAGHDKPDGKGHAPTMHRVTIEWSVG